MYLLSILIFFNNFSPVGYRSVYKDLEAEVAIVTKNKDLQQQLHDVRH